MQGGGFHQTSIANSREQRPIFCHKRLQFAANIRWNSVLYSISDVWPHFDLSLSPLLQCNFLQALRTLQLLAHPTLSPMKMRWPLNWPMGDEKKGQNWPMKITVCPCSTCRNPPQAILLTTSNGSVGQGSFPCPSRTLFITWLLHPHGNRMKPHLQMALWVHRAMLKRGTPQQPNQHSLHRCQWGWEDPKGVRECQPYRAAAAGRNTQDVHCLCQRHQVRHAWKLHPQSNSMIYWPGNTTDVSLPYRKHHPPASKCLMSSATHRSASAPLLYPSRTPSRSDTSKHYQWGWKFSLPSPPCFRQHDIIQSRLAEQ